MSPHQAHGHHLGHSTDAAIYIKEGTSSNFLLSNSRVRSRVTNSFKSRYKTLEEAEDAHNLTITSILGLEVGLDGRHVSRGVNKTTQTRDPAYCREQNQLVKFGSPCPPVREEIYALFLKLAVKRGISTNLGNFVTIALDAMKLLEEHGKSNIIYKFAQCLATNSQVTDKPLFDVTRMPFGLVEYQIEFFGCTNTSQVWHDTMCAEFPTRFNRLFRGPQCGVV